LGKLLTKVKIAKDTDTKLDVKPIASAAVKPFLAPGGFAGMTISAPGLMTGFFLNIKNLLI
jgi:hypothetical protein